MHNIANNHWSLKPVLTHMDHYCPLGWVINITLFFPTLNLEPMILIAVRKLNGLHLKLWIMPFVTKHI